MEDWRTISLVSGVLGLLTIATIIGQFLKRHPDTGLNAAAVGHSISACVRGG